MPQICHNCNTNIDTHTPLDETKTNIKVGCRVCNLNICFECGLNYAMHLGIKNNCLCPNCKSELGLYGEVDELGDDKYGWGY